MSQYFESFPEPTQWNGDPEPEREWGGTMGTTDNNGKFGFRTSQEIGEIAAALVSAQAKFGAAVKDSANPYYRSKYADLSAVIEATQKALNENGIAVLQAPQLDGQMVTVTTRLQHKSGQWYESDLTLPAVQGERFDAQSVGSAITYGRRYSLQAITGLATEDDDGNAASGIGSKQAAKAAGEAKIDEFLKKNPPAAAAALFFTWFEESKTAQITGDKQLITAQRDLLKKHWNPTVQAIVVDAETLENLKFQFGERNVPFKQLKEAHASRA